MAMTDVRVTSARYLKSLQVWGPERVAGGVPKYLRARVHAGRCSPPAAASYEVPFVLPEALEGFTIV
jgi:hypothetical protein